MNILHRYLVVVVAGISLLFGIQVPNFVDQYEKRLDAHLLEVTKNILPYQQIADKYHGGSIEELINFHRKSGVRTFQEEGIAIESMQKRKIRFENESAALKINLPQKVAHILVNRDRELLHETLQQYSYSIPLNQNAILSGITVTAAVVLVLELLLALARYILMIMTRLTSRMQPTR